MLKNKKILVAPLDWGLGHTTRCIPIVRTLQRCGARPILAASGSGHTLFRQTFPSLPLLQMPGYKIKYSSHCTAAFSLLSQLPKILQSFQQEHRWLQRQNKTLQLDGIISDNRYGLWHKNLPSVFMTHQLFIKPPPGLKWCQYFLNETIRGLLLKHDACWIPDFPPPHHLSGDLAHTGSPPHPNSYLIGTLSRFQPSSQKKSSNAYDIVAILSGPEPQRTYLEKKLIHQLQSTSYSTLIVRGKPQQKSYSIKENIRLVPHLDTSVLQRKIINARYVIARAGYSTIMDLIQLQKRAILIPTPGQTEQEYLAQRLHQKGFFYQIPQQHFIIEKALKQIDQLSTPLPPPPKGQLLKKALDNLNQIITPQGGYST